MFHFPSFPPRSLCVQLRVIRHNTVRGFPIRKSWYQRPVIDSSRLIADSHVLLRLPMPRHPPCALKNLTTNMIKIITSAKTLQSKESRKHTTPKDLCAPRFIIIRNCFAKQENLFHKMLASTIQFPNNNPVTPTTHTTPTPKRIDEPVPGLGHARETKNNKTNHTKPPKGT